MCDFAPPARFLKSRKGKELMKLIVRADDVGYTVAHNMGTVKTLDEGITTHCDLMLDCPGFEDACERLKNYPWISIGWHAHFWGKPVLSPEEVPSMVNGEGRFKWRHDHSLRNEVNYDEALKECRAQMARCKDLLGRIPDTCIMGGEDALGRAIRTVCEENGILMDFLQGAEYDGKERYCAPQYKDRNIVQFTSRGSKNSRGLLVEDFPYYHPADVLMEMPIDDAKTYLFVLHPGYLDDYILGESSCTIPRVRDVEALCEPRVRRWVKDNHIELVNKKDAILGTHEYQDHLKAIGSDLAV